MALLFMFDTIGSHMETYFTTQKSFTTPSKICGTYLEFEITHGIAGVSPTIQIYNVRDSA
jgi:hypothetical protein